jgi:hypothetical protein
MKRITAVPFAGNELMGISLAMVNGASRIEFHLRGRVTGESAADMHVRPRYMSTFLRAIHLPLSQAMESSAQWVTI